MKFTTLHMFIVGLIALIIGGGATAGFMYRVGFQNREGLLVRVGGSHEGFKNVRCPKPAPVAPCPRVMEPDLSKYILKSQVPSSKSTSVTMPDLSNYMLKTECPPVPDISKYVLKSSIPKPQPVIIDNSNCKKDAGECPPCPRPRCPVVNCPPPTKCPPPAPCPRPVCPPTVVKCKSEEASQSTVRPFLAPLNMGTFGMA